MQWLFLYIIKFDGGIVQAPVETCIHQAKLLYNGAAPWTHGIVHVDAQCYAYSLVDRYAQPARDRPGWAGTGRWAVDMQ
jgi:hypothetical protein